MGSEMCIRDRFLNDLEEEIEFSSVPSIFSRRKLAKIADFFELKVSRHHMDGFWNHFWMTPATFFSSK